MKITFLTPTLELHGGNIVMLKHADFLVEKGHKITIITTNKPIGLPLNPKIKILQCKAVGLKYLDFFTFQLVYLQKVVNLIEECDIIIPIYAPLIVHAIAGKKRKGLKAKIIPLFQDSLVTLWVGPYIRFVLGLKYIKENIDAVVAVSRPGKEGFEKYSGKQANFIPIAIETEHFRLRKELKKENFIFFVGRPNKAKGFPVFAEAYQIIKKQFPNIRAIAITPTLEDQELNGIQFIKYKNREQLAELYSKAKVYVSASYAESFPMPPLEAMASGTAVVVTNTGGEQEYAVDGKNASVVPVGNPKAIANATVDLLNNEIKMNSYIEEGFKTSQKYSWNKSNNLFLEFLEKNKSKIT